MKTNLKLLFTFLSSLILIALYLPVKASLEERYDNLLAKSEKEKTKDQEPRPIPVKHTLTFEHEKFPNLNGVWLLSKKTISRKTNPLIKKPLTFVHCNKRLPFEQRDFVNKEVLINAWGPDQFAIRAIYPVTNDIYTDPNQKKDIEYQHFSFKGVIDPDDLTYSYTLKLKDHLESLTLARDLWLKGRLYFDHISRNKITAHGYEVEYTPECEGFLIDEIAFEFKKERDVEGTGGALESIPVIEQPAYAEPPLEPESAKEKTKFEPASIYKKVDTTETPPKKPIKVPGLW